MRFQRKGDKNKYSFSNERCIGRQCWSPGMFQHQRATVSPCCMTRAYHGCPEGPEGERIEDDAVIVGQPVYQIELARVRKAEGWRLA